MTRRTLPTATAVLTDETAPVDVMIPVTGREIPGHLRPRDGYLTRWWQEVMGTFDCKYGCKVYARKRGCIVQYAVFHSSTYGHARTR